jgi:hypothetical protein
MDAVVLGLVAMAMGTVVAAYGTRAFYLLLPVFGFGAGFLLGGQAVTGLLGDGLFSTLLGWLVGLGVGAVLAVLAGLWWYAAIVILAGAIGYEVGSGLLVAIGIDPGLLTLIAGLVVAVGFVAAAIVLDAPTLYVAALTGFGGAAYGVAGAYLLIGQISVAQLRDGPLGALSDHPIGLAAWFGLGAVALAFQYLDLRRIAMERIDRSPYRFA